jgi:PKHD-type hydroxylase
MRGEWCYFKSHFTPEQCDKILEDGLQLPAQDAKLGVAGMSEHEPGDYRKSKIRFIQSNDPEFQFLFDEIWKMGMQANRDWFNFHVTNLSFIQLAEYDSSYQGEYKKHHDVFWINNDKYHRKLTCVIQLSDPNEYEGGDFELFDLTGGQYPNKEELRQQGTAIFIPSFTPHQAHPVTKGTRYSIAVWFEGPKWV